MSGLSPGLKTAYRNKCPCGIFIIENIFEGEVIEKVNFQGQVHQELTHFAQRKCEVLLPSAMQSGLRDILSVYNCKGAPSFHGEGENHLSR